MRKLLFLLFILKSFLLAGNIPHDSTDFSDSLIIQAEDFWIANDKAQHLIGSFYLTGISKLSIQKFSNHNSRKSFQYAISITLSLSLLKEFYDAGKPRNHFSYKDICTNLVGILLAATVFN
jgi:uncharacterized protein YfiM (DUF2279 family)